MDSSDDDFDGDFNNPYDNAVASLRNMKTANKPVMRLPLKLVKPSLVAEVIDLDNVPISCNTTRTSYASTSVVSEVIELNENANLPVVVPAKQKPKRKSKKSTSNDIQNHFTPTAKRRSGRLRRNNGLHDSSDIQEIPEMNETVSTPQEMSLAQSILSTLQVLFGNQQGTSSIQENTIDNQPGTLDAPQVTTTNRRRPSRNQRGGTSAQRGASTTRGRGRKKRQPTRQYLSPNIPTYSVGNTAEYDDTMENVPLFVNVPMEGKIDMDAEREKELLCEDVNEDLTVKVHWQHMNFVKFNLRRYQKFKIIFDFFAEREKVAPEKILLTLCGRVLSPNDSPEVVDYNIRQFIEGGFVTESVNFEKSEETTDTSGILLKFQCENRKRQFKFNVPHDRKLQMAMVRCAEEFEVPIGKLRFYFDGDLLAETNTPLELELEGGECIDVVVQK